MKRNKGYTLVELMIVVWLVAIIALLGGVGWVVVHFIHKYW